MGVPESIRKVPRPVNTVVSDNGKDTVFRYPVRERSRVIYVPGGNPQPRNGKVIGHIINGEFVALADKTAEKGPDMLSYGGAALFHDITSDLYSDLLAVYPANEAAQIMAIAGLRVIKQGIASNRLSAHYNRTFISIFYPGAALSQNTVKNLLERIGMDGKKRKAFFERRLKAVAEDHHLAVDGTLKQDTSTENDLSAFSYKARVKGCEDISVLYAYDIELMEPVCSQVFPGNSIDASSYSSFIRDNNIHKGIIVADKGFPPSKIREELNNRPDLHFLTPIKRNDTRIKNNQMLDFEGVLKNTHKHVLYKKCQIQGGNYLYAFRDTSQAGAEEYSYIEKIRTGKEFDKEKFDKKSPVFGVIVLESDQDLDPETAYACYEDRWLLELTFRAYKSNECLDRTRVQGDFTVIGSEFINFISTTAACRIIRKATRAGILKELSYKEMMDDLNSAWRTTDGSLTPHSDDGHWVHTLDMVFEELEALGLSVPAPKPEPKKRGRKPKPKVDKPKRPRGRPRKNPNPQDL